jgi:hypothetical protein
MSSTNAQKKHKQAVEKQRANKTLRRTLEVETSCYLFVVHNNKTNYHKIMYHLQDPEMHQPVWEHYPLLNHCIHKLCAPTTEQLGNIEIQLNHNQDDPKEGILERIREVGSVPLTRKEEPGHTHHTMPDHNHALGLNFFSNGMKFKTPFYKNVYFMRLSAIMKDLKQDPTMGALLTFLQQNFDIMCWADPGWDTHMDGDNNVLFEGPEGRKLYLKFLMEAKNECGVFYIESLGLPSKFLMLPPLDEEKRARWMDLTWGELSKQLGNLDSFAPPIANGPIDGIVLKPKK